MLRWLEPLSLLVCVGLSACGGYNSRGDSGELSGDGEAITVVGTVRVAGSTPFERVMLGPMDGPERELRGGPLEELIRLQGATVRVRGRSAERNTFRVTDYEILEIGGERPVVGILERASGGALGVRESTGDWLELDGAPEALGEKVGSKVWVITGPDGGVRSFGVLRERVEDSG